MIEVSRLALVHPVFVGHVNFHSCVVHSYVAITVMHRYIFHLTNRKAIDLKSL